MTRRCIFQMAACLAALALMSSLASAQPAGNLVAKQQPAGKDEELTLKVYRVADLFTPRPDYPYRGGLPTTDTGNMSPSGNVGGGMSGGGGGLGGGSMGGGFFQVSDPIRVAQFGGGGGGLGGGSGLGGGGLGSSAGMDAMGGLNSTVGGEESLRFTRDELIQAITSTILPESWETYGGKGVCTPLGGLLLIKQTAEAHKLIEKLLSDIRTEGGTSHTVTIDALWLSLTADDFEKLAPGQKGQGGDLSPVDPKQLKDLANNNPSHQGRLSCYNDQTVHLVAGNRRTVVVNVVPTVGFYSIGYTPQVAFPNVGVLLQIRPTVDPNRKSAVLNVTSTVTEWEDPGEPFKITTKFEGGENKGIVTKGGATEVTVDRVNLNTQHLGTTVRMPVGQPVLVGGLSRVGTDLQTKPKPEDKDKEKESDRQLYLIIKITVNEESNPPAGK